MFSEAELSNAYPQQIQPFWQNQVQSGVLRSHDGLQLRHYQAIPTSPKGIVVISSGRTEAAIKYKEVMYDLFHQGYGVMTMDHRGQGLSERMTPRPDQGHVGQFADYVQDLKAYVDTEVKSISKDLPTFLLCHSMGCAIGALYILEHHNDFQRVVFNAPMFGIKAPISEATALKMCGFFSFLNRVFGKAPWYFPGQKDYVQEAFADNPVTRSEVRFKLTEQEYQQHAEARLGGITIGWLQQAILAMQHIRQQAHHIQVPTLLLQAGADAIVDNECQQQVIAQLPNVSVKIIADAQHEILLERDCYRQPAMQAILDFFATDDELLEP